MDAVIKANREAWESASRKHVREYDDLLAQAESGNSLNAAERELLKDILWPDFVKAAALAPFPVRDCGSWTGNGARGPADCPFSPALPAGWTSGGSDCGSGPVPRHLLRPTITKIRSRTRDSRT
jgi:hypothetical protein